MTAQQTTAAGAATFPAFDLARLFRTVFLPGPRERVAVLTDLPDPRDVAGLRFLDDPALLPARRHAWRTLFEGLVARREDLDLAGVAFFAYEETGGSNLDLPEAAFTPDGGATTIREVFGRHSIVLFMGRFSATAPATALAKELGIRGATMHGTNDLILSTGLAVDYERVSARAERLRLALTRAERMRLEWTVRGRAAGPAEVAMDVELGGQEAQKSHGLVRATGDIANLPAGEVYFVPTGAEGILPRQFEDGDGAPGSETIALLRVTGGRIAAIEEVVRGDRAAAERLMATVERDPAVGALGELGLGTQSLPFAGADIQDEKIIGTAHLATGRDDHLGGGIGPAAFRDRRNATHEDILWTPRKTPDIELTRVTMLKDGEWRPVLERWKPAAWMEELL